MLATIATPSLPHLAPPSPGFACWPYCIFIAVHSDCRAICFGGSPRQATKPASCIRHPIVTALRMRQVSERVLETDEPVIGKTKALMAGVEGVLSLAQGAQPRPPHTECAAPRAQS